MKNTQHLHDLGQSLWLDNITGEMLDNGANAFVKSWSELMQSIAAKSAALGVS